VTAPEKQKPTSLSPEAAKKASDGEILAAGWFLLPQAL